ncbi:hypothetical protein JKG47_18585, partial [Acidithiobacillus sp. MC6.1]|nr:hypothetical protein [Acidithiobacillus sp. MC6.1]
TRQGCTRQGCRLQGCRLQGWETLTFDRHAMTSLHRNPEKAQRQERLWINPKMARHFAQGEQQPLFG